MQGLGRVASDGSEGADTPATASAFGERLGRRKQPQQAASAKGEHVTGSPPGANLLHSGACRHAC